MKGRANLGLVDPIQCVSDKRIYDSSHLKFVW